MTRKWIAPVAVAAMLVFALVALPWLPEQIPTHWDWRGQVDDWAPKWPGVLFLPGIALAVWALLIGLRRIDPRRKHYERFDDTWWRLINLIVLFMALIHGLTLAYALGVDVDVGRAVLGCVGLLFIALGNYLPRVRSNWWMGIRTPWTLESETVWRKTHRLAGRAFVGGGLAAVVGAVLPSPIGSVLAMAGLGAAGLIPVVYSYVAWSRERSEGRA